MDGDEDYASSHRSSNISASSSQIAPPPPPPPRPFIKKLELTNLYKSSTAAPKKLLIIPKETAVGAGKRGLT